MTELVQQARIDEGTDAARRARFPVGAALTFADLEDAGGEPALDALREAEPVSWVPALGGWLVTSRRAARVVLRSRAVTVEARENLVRASLGVMMLTSDDDHRRLRGPFDPPFKLGTVERTFAEAVRDEATTLLDGLVGAGSAEIGSEFAAPFSVRMAGRLLGLSLEDTAQIAGFYAAFAAAMVYDGDPEPQRRADAARTDLNRILHRELDRGRRGGLTSITSLVAADPGVDLTDDEIVAQLRVILFGAIETVQASIMNTLLLLLRHPGQLASVRGDETLLEAAAEEACRLIPPVAFVERWTREPLPLDGVTIPAAEFVGVSVVAANRDPATFPEPLRFDARRPNAARALTFSFGPHLCLGLHVARLETRIALAVLLAGLPDLRLVAHDPPAGFAFRRPATLHLAWST